MPCLAAGHAFLRPAVEAGYLDSICRPVLWQDNKQLGFLQAPDAETVGGLGNTVRTLKLRIQFCGGCNPEIDRGLLVKRLKQLIESVGIKPIICKDDQADWLILVNGCSRACLEEQFPESENGSGRISVQGTNLDCRPMAENDLPRTIWDTMRRF